MQTRVSLGPTRQGREPEGQARAQVKSFEIDKRRSRWLAMYKLKRFRGRFAKAMASFWPCPARCSQALQPE